MTTPGTPTTTATETARKDAWELCQDATRLWNSLKTPTRHTTSNEQRRRIKLAKSMRASLDSIGGLLDDITQEIDAQEEAPPLKLNRGGFVAAP